MTAAATRKYLITRDIESLTLLRVLAGDPGVIEFAVSLLRACTRSAFMESCLKTQIGAGPVGFEPTVTGKLVSSFGG